MLEEELKEGGRERAGWEVRAIKAEKELESLRKAMQEVGGMERGLLVATLERQVQQLEEEGWEREVAAMTKEVRALAGVTGHQNGNQRVQQEEKVKGTIKRSPFKELLWAAAAVAPAAANSLSDTESAWQQQQSQQQSQQQRSVLSSSRKGEGLSSPPMSDDRAGYRGKQQQQQQQPGRQRRLETPCPVFAISCDEKEEEEDEEDEKEDQEEDEGDFEGGSDKENQKGDDALVQQLLGSARKHQLQQDEERAREKQQQQQVDEDVKLKSLSGRGWKGVEADKENLVNWILTSPELEPFKQQQQHQYQQGDARERRL